MHASIHEAQQPKHSCSQVTIYGFLAFTATAATAAQPTPDHGAYYAYLLAAAQAAAMQH
jgi:hypothetical protein